MKTFEHNFNTPFGIVDINGIQGFIKCMNEIYKHIESVTNFNPAKKYIDAVPLLNKMSATSAELAELLNKEQVKIKEEVQAVLSL